MRKYLIFYSLILMTIVLSFVCMKDVIVIAKSTLDLVLFNLFPTLFPFMCLLLLSLNYGLFDILGSFLVKILPFLHLSKTGLSIFIASLFSGYPTNITLILQAFKQHKLSLNESYTLIKCASFASPSFILIGLSLPNEFLFPIYFSHIMPSILYLIFFHKNQKDNRIKTSFTWPKESFVSIIKSIFKTCLYPFIFIYGFILVFRVLSFFLSLFLPLDIVYYIQGLLEFSSGILNFIDYFPYTIFSISMIAFFLSFSGLSVIMQSDSLLDLFPHSLGMLVKYRFIHGLASFILCFTILLLK